MAGIELYAQRKLKHRRTWTVAAVVLGLVFMIGGEIGAYLPAVAAGFVTPGGGAMFTGPDTSVVCAPARASAAAMA